MWLQETTICSFQPTDWVLLHACPCVLVCLFAALYYDLLYRKAKSHKAALRGWAERRRMEILECSRRYFFCGPFAFRCSSSDSIYRIRVRNKRGKEWSAFARVRGLPSTRVEVVFDRESGE